MKKFSSYLSLAIAATLWASCSSSAPKQADENPVSVEVYQPVSQDSAFLSVSGTLSAQNSAEISTRMMANVEQIYVKTGDQVKAGQLLVRLNADDLQAKKKQVQAQISTAQLATENARRDYQRYQNLHAQQSVSDKELENMQLNLSAMESRLQMARQSLKEVEAMLAHTYIKAPFAGKITQKNIDKGSMTQPGMPLLILEQQHEMEVTATIPESYISNVAKGDRVEVEVKSIKRKLQGTVSELSPSATLNGGQYAMKLQLEEKQDPQLLSGMYVAIRIPNKSHVEGSKKLLIDQKALVHREQLTGVYVINADHRAVLRWLRLGKTYGDQVEVLSGLNAQERVIVHAKGKLYNGRKIKID